MTRVNGGVNTWVNTCVDFGVDSLWIFRALLRGRNKQKSPEIRPGSHPGFHLGFHPGFHIRIHPGFHLNHPKSSQNHSNTITKPCQQTSQHHPQTMPKPFQNHPKASPGFLFVLLSLLMQKTIGERMTGEWWPAAGTLTVCAFV